jgi:hypothetical protein
MPDPERVESLSVAVVTSGLQPAIGGTLEGASQIPIGK